MWGLLVSALTTLLGVALHFLCFYFAPQTVERSAFLFHCVFFLTSFASYYVVGLVRSDANKTPWLLLVHGGRLIAVLIVVIVILLRFKEIEPVRFFFNLLFVYFYYTSFELYFIIRTLRPNSESGKK